MPFLACSKETPPEWMDLASQVSEIEDAGIEAKKTLLEGGKKWIKEVVKGKRDPVAEFSKGKTNAVSGSIACTCFVRSRDRSYLSKRSVVSLYWICCIMDSSEEKVPSIPCLSQEMNKGDAVIRLCYMLIESNKGMDRCSRFWVVLSRLIHRPMNNSWKAADCSKKQQ